MATAAQRGLVHADVAAARAALPEWWPVIAGLLVLFVPTLVDLFSGPWIGEEQGHGPIIFGLALWLIYRKWPAMLAASANPSASVASGNPNPNAASVLPPRSHAVTNDSAAADGDQLTRSNAAAGWPLLVFGLTLHVLGHSQQILIFAVAAMAVVPAAVLLLKRGTPALATLWFPFFFMLFMLPLPGEFVAMLTLPMKMAVSWCTEQLLFAAGFPIARSGVILQIGQYQLLVADACAGLQTLLTLEALGLFYLNLVRHPSALRNITLALLIVPISFSANVVRVITLTLVTYYFGDAAGQGFLHGFAGMLLFLTALALIISLDSALQWLARRRGGRA